LQSDTGAEYFILILLIERLTCVKTKSPEFLKN
jgi:hypothetical protein